MRISIPVDEKTWKQDMYLLWTRSYFLIHDTEIKENEFIVNSAATSTGSARIKAKIVMEIRADYQCREKCIGYYQAYGIKIYKTFRFLSRIIDAFIAGFQS